MATPETVAATVRHDLIATLCDRESAEAYARDATSRCRVFVEVNTGGERLGIAPDKALDFIRWLGQFPHLEVAGIYTHPGVPSKGRAVECVQWQFERFARALETIAAAGIEIPVRMAASSKILRLTDRMTLTAVDPGNLIYGLDPGGPGTHDLGVRPALVGLKSRLVHIHDLERTEFLDEAPVPVRPGLKIGVIPMGASDRLNELHLGRVLVRGRYAAVLGKLSAEHAKIDLTEVPEARVGDEVTMIGRQGEEAITVAQVARHRGVPEADILLALPISFERTYRAEDRPDGAAAGRRGRPVATSPAVRVG